MTHVLVLAGGTSDEREISLRSGAAVAEALKIAGYQVTTADTSELTQLNPTAFDVAFPALHGTGGEDGTAQAQLESLGLPYVGSGVDASELCFDKWRWREFVASHDVPVPSGALVEADTLRSNPLALSPFVLKPFDGGSSIDTFIVRDVEQAPWQDIEAAFVRHPRMLLEQLVSGIEITVAVVGDRALPVIEIIPPESGEFDYENKYNGASQELCPPVNVAANVQEAAQLLAAKIHQLCGCRDLSRTDMMVGEDGSLAVLETNTIPGLTNESLLPKAAATAGLTMTELCSQLVEAALKRRIETV